MVITLADVVDVSLLSSYLLIELLSRVHDGQRFPAVFMLVFDFSL